MMNRRLLNLIGCVLILAACQQNIAKPETLPDGTTTTGIGSDAIAIDEEAEREGAELMARHPGGIAVGFYGTNEEIMPNYYTTFRIQKEHPFVGEFRLRSGKLEEHSYIFLCLLDYLQIPCNPQADMTQLWKGVDLGDEVRIPLYFFVGDGDFHDLVVLYQEDPYLAGPIGSGSFQDRTLRDFNEMRANISVDGRTTSPSLLFIEPNGQSGHGSIPYGCVVEEAPTNSDEHGGWRLLTETTAQAGDYFDLFLHFDGDTDRKHAVTAFIDFRQIPIYYDGELHTPLYVQTRAETLHILPIRFRAPDLPGNYELRIIAMAEPFAWLDSLPDGKELTAFPKSSPRILLKVTPND